MKKFFSYLRMAFNFIKSAEEAGVIEEVKKAFDDKKITVKEVLLITIKICDINGIDFDTKGINLEKILK